MTKYLEGDYDSLCRKNFYSGMDQFYDYVIKELSSGVSSKDVFRNLIQKGYKGGQTAAYDYMNKIIECFQIDIAVYRSSSADAVQKKKKLQKYDHISRNGIFRFLWMNHAITDRHKSYLMDTYPQLRTLMSCIREFREIFQKKNMPCLYLFIEKYKNSDLKELSRFASGLEKDLAAVENAVASPLSNGFVEGTNSKLKMIKRTMCIYRPDRAHCTEFQCIPSASSVHVFRKAEQSFDLLDYERSYLKNCVNGAFMPPQAII